MKEESTIQLAKRMDQLPPYLFGMINKMKMEKRRQGHDVIDLGMGNPVDPTPAPIIEKLCEVAKDPKAHRYPAADGMKSLRKEIAASYRKDYDVSLQSETEVICTIGSKEGISHLSLALVGPGDTVLVPAPAFPIHIYAAVIAGGNVTRVAMGEEEDALLKQIHDHCARMQPRPKVLVLNYPHNPTAMTGSLALFEGVVALARKFGFVVVHDFAYGKIAFDGYKPPSFMQAKGAAEVGVEFGTFSKSYNMAGWRLGYCVGNRQIIAGLAKIKGYYDYGVFSAIQVAGIIALRECEEDIKRQVEKYQHRRDILCDGLKRMGWDVCLPKAGMFVWAKLPEPFFSMGSMAFSLELMNHAHVAVAPGIGFGEEGEGYLRLALVENEQRMKQALKQIQKALPEIKAMSPASLHL
jgi:alanine-synthesizing transaminase